MNVGVIGCGASGMMAAITASRNGHNVVILEHNENPGKKLLSTGNGKCNYTNNLMNHNYYNENGCELFDSVYAKFTNADTIKFFEEIGVYPYEKNGYYYPRSEQASSVVTCLVNEVKSLNVKTIYNCNIIKIEKEKDFIVKTDKGDFAFNKLIMATGSNAAPKTGSDGSGYGFAIKLGHKVKKPLPALCGLKCEEEHTNFKDISGVRCKAKVSLIINDKEIKSDIGELQLTDYGISGIPVFQISGEALRLHDKAEKVRINVDYAPEFELNILTDLILKRCEHMKGNSILDLFEGLFNSKLGSHFIEKANNDIKKFELENVTEDIAKKLASIIKNNIYNLKGHRGFDNCQVCSGGIELNEVKMTLESKLCKGLYFAGEILDINGECGGYNLQWAWSSGYTAGLLQ